MGCKSNSRACGAIMCETIWPLYLQVELPLSLGTGASAHRTTILQAGEVDGKGCVWHVVGGRKRFPFPPGYK